MDTKQLKKMCARGEATAETFEEAIKADGLTVEIMAVLKAYYAGDYIEDDERVATELAEAEAHYKMSMNGD